MPRLGLLICDTPKPNVLSVHGSYKEIFHSLLKNSLERTRPGEHVEWTLDGFDVVNQVYPPPDDIDSYDGFLISGSAASAYAPLEWLPPLFSFVKDLIENHTRIKIFGICFGQQVISIALGGTCVPNTKGWEVGTYEVDLSETGKLIFGRDILRIQEMHRDIVPTPPPNFVLLGSTPKCEVQGLALSTNPGQPIKSLQDVHVLTVQGHPEFIPDIVQKVIDNREQAGIFQADFVREARERAESEHDGVDVIAKVIWDMLVPRE